jgi:hypothetical protein
MDEFIKKLEENYGTIIAVLVTIFASILIYYGSLRMKDNDKYIYDTGLAGVIVGSISIALAWGGAYLYAKY